MIIDCGGWTHWNSSSLASVVGTSDIHSNGYRNVTIVSRTAHQVAGLLHRMPSRVLGYIELPTFSGDTRSIKWWA